MERLTERFDGCAMRKGCHGPCGTCNGAKCAGIYPMIDRLAAYEDTGLEPKQAMLISNVLREVGETYNCWFDYVVNCVLENSHLKDLAQAEKAGRLEVMPPNAPLTLEELREMDGEPVWVTSVNNGRGRSWTLVDTKYEICREVHGGLAVFENYGKTWLAYRRKPEEGTWQQ